MEQFPSSFVAQKIQSDVVNNRLKKIEQDMKALRKKIVKSFHGSVHYHSEVTHEMISDLSEEEQKNFYCMAKDELQQRGFVVRGKITGNVLSLIMFSNAPRTNEMDRVLRQYSEDHEEKTPEPKQSSSVPNSPAKSTGRKSKIPSAPKTPKVKKIRSSSIPNGDKAKKQLSKIPRLLTRSASQTLKPSTKLGESSSIPILTPRSAQSNPRPVPPIITANIPQSDPNGSDRSDPITSCASSPKHTPRSPPQPQSNPISLSQNPLPNSPQANSPPPPPQQLHPSQPTDLNMEFIMNKLKQANRKKA